MALPVRQAAARLKQTKAKGERRRAAILQHRLKHTHSPSHALPSLRKQPTQVSPLLGVGLSADLTDERGKTFLCHFILNCGGLDSGVGKLR